MAVQINSFARIVPMIYAYNTPGVSYHEGWTKVGYTERQTVEQRIAQQTHTAHIHWELAWADNAMYKDSSGEYFTDHDFHAYLESLQVAREPHTEWFHADGMTLLGHFHRFASRKTLQAAEKHTYELRREQADAVQMTADYFKNGGTEFLWNAKPRFGKTLTSYDLIRRMGFTKVLIVTNRPSIANSWAEDFHRFIAWRDEFAFVSDTEALRSRAGVLSREAYMALPNMEEVGMVAFESLQGLKGSVYFGGEFDKLRWMSELSFDLLIVDEAQEGVDTMRTERAFRQIHRAHTLYLSGTPFKALASAQFTADQIYNWSYADEQEAKAHWAGDGYNPYEPLPQLSMFTYQLSPMIAEDLRQGMELDDESVDYAFDLNEFFATNEGGRFVHEAEIRKFLHALRTNEKYPFSTEELRRELPHTLWLLNRVASAKALARLLREDPVFRDYEVVLAAGDGALDDVRANDAAYDRVRETIRKHARTITLSVGQLTVGVTIPEWCGVLMLCNLQSPSSYMQAAFRAQNPCTLTVNGQRMRKERAYVFDFDPARTLIIFDEFANNLSPETADGRGTGAARETNIRRLLNFFPVLGEDDAGRMVQLDAAQVLSIPRRLKSMEVVRRGFLSNFLFQNIGNVFGAPAIVREIMEKLMPAQEETRKNNAPPLDDLSCVAVDENGDVAISNEIVIGQTRDIFGAKHYAEIEEHIAPHIDRISVSDGAAAVQASMERLAASVKEKVRTEIVAPVADAYEVKAGVRKRLLEQTERELDRRLEELRGDYVQEENIARAELERQRSTAETQAEVQAAEESFDARIAEALDALKASAAVVVKETIENKPAELVERMERVKAEEKKRTVEDEVRARLRGFSRTIPSFIMAYGDENMTLANFDDYTDDDVFEEVTGISEEDFRFLRDGGTYRNPETGAEEPFAGHIFDEVVFNDSIAEFWRKKEELANYFDEGHTEDIFDYIPPQKTNQIFTPRRVVRHMVDALERENPGCYDDPTHTFADLYMKSGLYITEIVKRLYHSDKIKEAYPNDAERIRHILQYQVYGMAPTRIIYLIATNYILGFDERMKSETQNFVQADAAQAAKEGRLAELVEECFGEAGDQRDF
ncbi:DEAD/DEAH box helicase family protein [Selenomonas noxia]|uniref:DEAD/DEAH box helicase family protein n=1 Tax=Selenomonas noxia TaxID=135083 RepID=UPI0028E83AF9|nr:DEAD/DEAH box helicase family protein [Selenomonas noxia]